MKVLFFFWDGVGLGNNDPTINPFLTANTPTFDTLLGGLKIQAKNPTYYSDICSFVGIDAQLGVPGIPQSATGQASLLSGINIPKKIGKHYGPKPNPQIVDLIEEFSHNRNNGSNANLFSKLSQIGKKSVLINAYPEVYFNSISSRKRNHSVIPLMATNSGMSLLGEDNLRIGDALSADFTSQGWHDHLQLFDTPLRTPKEAGKLMAHIIQENDLSFFEYWEPDLAGHKQDMLYARKIIEKLDKVLEGLLENINWENNLVLITSDHGNMEDLSTRKHTCNQVPAILIGRSQFHQNFKENMQSLLDIAPFLWNVLAE